MSGLIEDKIVVITGGAGLLGKEFCQAIAANGAIAVMAEYDLSVAEKVCNALGNSHIVPAQVDITNKDSVAALITTISEKYGKIDALVNSSKVLILVTKTMGSIFLMWNTKIFVRIWG